MTLNSGDDENSRQLSIEEVKKLLWLTQSKIIKWVKQADLSR